MSQIQKRRITPETRAGQYMCPECGQIFDTKTEVDNHIYKMQEHHVKTMSNGINIH